MPIDLSKMISNYLYALPMLLILFFCVILKTTAKNNVCKNFSDYVMNMDNNPNCWYDPELYMNASQVLKHMGYNFEQYEIETEDGYILTTFRLPQPENTTRKGVIMLVPPMVSSCICFIDVKNESFAFMIWNSGYEVWLANIRGTIYGRKHRKYNPDVDMAFWDFSFHEMGLYDLPATAAYASKISGSFETIILGYSMSSTASLIYGSIRPDHALKYTKAFVLWAPSANMAHTRTLTKQLSSLRSLVEVLGTQGMKDVLPHNKLMWDILGLCRRGPFVVMCLSLELYIFEGQDPSNVRPDWFPFKLGHNPGGVAYHTIAHYLQLAKSGEFKGYDYGMEGNLKHYNSSMPPYYPVENIRTPVVLVYGSLDVEAPEIDVLALYKRLSPEAGIYKPIKLTGMHHGGFVYNNMATWKVYIPTIQLFDQIYRDVGKKTIIHNN